MAGDRIGRFPFALPDELFAGPSERDFVLSFVFCLSLRLCAFAPLRQGLFVLAITFGTTTQTMLSWLLNVAQILFSRPQTTSSVDSAWLLARTGSHMRFFIGPEDQATSPFSPIISI